MNPNLLAKLFGADGRWCGPCRVILDANADVQSISNDSFVQGGLKNFAPRRITGRVAADAVRLLPDQQALLLVQTTVIRQGTGEDIVKRSMLVVDTGHVAAIEFPDLGSLSALGIDPPK